MNNISWAKTVGNWGANRELVSKDSKNKIEKQIISIELMQESKQQCIEVCSELIENAHKMYNLKSNKELYDALISLESAKRALCEIY